MHTVDRQKVSSANEVTTLCCHCAAYLCVCSHLLQQECLMLEGLVACIPSIGKKCHFLTRFPHCAGIAPHIFEYAAVRGDFQQDVAHKALVAYPAAPEAQCSRWIPLYVPVFCWNLHMISLAFFETAICRMLLRTMPEVTAPNVKLLCYSRSAFLSLLLV